MNALKKEVKAIVYELTHDLLLVTIIIAAVVVIALLR